MNVTNSNSRSEKVGLRETRAFKATYPSEVCARSGHSHVNGPTKVFYRERLPNWSKNVRWMRCDKVVLDAGMTMTSVGSDT